MLALTFNNKLFTGITASLQAKNSTENIQEAIESKKKEIYNALDHLIPGKIKMFPLTMCCIKMKVNCKISGIFSYVTTYLHVPF